MTVPEPRKRVLIRLPNWLGDAVMAAPAVLGLAEARPDWEWLLLGGPRSLPLYAGVEEPFRLLPSLPPRASRPAGFLRTVRRLRRERADAALLLPPSFSSAWMAATAGIPVRAGWSGDRRSALLTLRAPLPARTGPLRDQYCRLAESFLDTLAPEGAPWKLPGGVRRLPLRPEEFARARAVFASAGLIPKRTIVLAPGATFGPTKRWPEERFVDLARRLLVRGYGVLWIGGAEEREPCARMAAATEGMLSVSVAGGLPIRTSLAVLALARAAVSNDSGALHLAQAAGCPVLGIYGSTSPVWTGPDGACSVLYDAIACSPCFSRTCPTQVECLSGIGPDRAEAALLDLLERTEAACGRPAVFLDRDGTVLDLVPYLDRAEDVRLAPGAASGLRLLREAGYALVVVTNQSAIARGLLDRAGLRAIHRRMEALLEVEGIRLDGIEVCPHHPDFTEACACRKPEPGLLLRAAHRLALDPGRSWTIGDSRSDLVAGRNAGTRTILVRTGYGREVEAGIVDGEEAGREESGRAGDGPARPLYDFVCDGLEDAARLVLASAGSETQRS